MKKIIAGLLAVSLIFGAGGVFGNMSEVAFAASLTADEEHPMSGKCGENVTWVLDEDGTLTVSGEGDMDSEQSSELVYHKSDIKKIVVEDGVTSIGDSAFSSFENLTSVILSDSVTSVGNFAFYYCAELADITIPESVTNIGRLAFESTLWLENKQKEDPLVIVNNILIDGTKCKGEITIPNTVTSICSGAFFGDSDLTAVKIPDSVTSMDIAVFFDCYNLTKAELPNSLTSIPEWTFMACENLTSVNLPDSLTSIKERAFGDCESLTEVNIPDGVTSMGLCAFDGCKSLKEVTIPDSVTSIGDYAFDNCKNLKSVTIPESVTEIGEQAFGYDYDLGGVGQYKLDGFTIIGHKGSAAEKYAKEEGFTFIDQEEGSEIVKVKGDLFVDGSVNVVDLSVLAAHIKGKKMLKDVTAADFNGDGKTDVTDLSKLAAHIKGKKML